MKMHKKRLFENHAHDRYQNVPQNFKCPKVYAVRDWPRLCGKFVPPTESEEIGDNKSARTAANFQAPVEHIVPSSCSSTTDSEVRRHKVPRSYHTQEVFEIYPIVRDFPAGPKFVCSSAKLSAEPRPLVFIATCNQSPVQEMQDDSAHSGVFAKRSSEGSNEIWNNFGGGVGETSCVVKTYDGDAKELCSLLGQEIQDGRSLTSSLERSGRKETGNEVLNDFGGDVVETYEVAKEIFTSLGQEMKGGEARNHTFERSTLRETIIQVQNNSRDGETSSFMGRWDDDAKELHINHQSEAKLSELEPWCQKVGNKAEQGKKVLRNNGKEIEDCRKDQISKNHQAIGKSGRVQDALNLFQELLEQLRYKANRTATKVNPRKLPAEAAMTLKRQQKWVNTTKRLGHVPGIEVGDRFHYRVELAIIGLHSHFQNGIDYMEKDGKLLAVSVVDSGRYANNKESSDVLIYSGQGGNPMAGYHQQPEDQKLERGNLALKNSMDAKTPVRVTRGFQAVNATSISYTYDGLFFVDKYWQGKGPFGTLVFKFQLKRITAEPKTTGQKYGETSGVEVKWGLDVNEIGTSDGQEIQGRGGCCHTLLRNPSVATIKEVQNNLRDGVTSGFTGGWDGNAKETHIHHQSEKKLSELDPWCQIDGNKADRGKKVLGSIGKEIEICGKVQISKDHQAIGKYSRVQDALNLFQELLEQLRYKANRTATKVNPRKLPAEAAMTLKSQRKWVNTTKRLGQVPGIEVGDKFHYRVELAIIGLHSHFQNGIDYMEKDGKVLAISVVDSGRYANDKESSDVLIYMGQGGNPMVGHNKQPEDQKLERGNLALKNSMDAKTPVRVTRGFQAMNATSTGYTYDGLYFVDKYWQEKGQFGTLVFKFQLKRVTGELKIDQRELYESKKSKVSLRTVFNGSSYGRKLNKSKESKLCRKTILNFISLGKEERPIHVVNEIDYEKPQPFTYIARMEYLESSSWSIPSGCDCTDGCTDSVKCACVLKNGGEIPFNCHGALIEKRPLIYECGPLCKCPPSCNNRVGQNGIRLQLEVFKTKSAGWGVRSRDFISFGSFICEFVGELIQDKGAVRRATTDGRHLFDLGNGASAIDASKSGNVGRFINHSCSPNLFAQKVLYDHNDKRLPHIMLFATKAIPPMRELTYCYNNVVTRVFDINGQIKQKKCCCGSQECTGRMF